MKFLLSAFLILALAVLGLPSQGFTEAIHFKAALDSPSEDPPNASPGTGIGHWHPRHRCPHPITPCDLPRLDRNYDRIAYPCRDGPTFCR